MAISWGEDVLEQAFRQKRMSLNNFIPCKHPNCALCAEDVKQIEEERKIIAERKAAYKRRCEEYMKRFRAKEE